MRPRLQTDLRQRERPSPRPARRARQATLIAMTISVTYRRPPGPVLVVVGDHTVSRGKALPPRIWLNVPSSSPGGQGLMQQATNKPPSTSDGLDRAVYARMGTAASAGMLLRTRAASVPVHLRHEEVHDDDVRPRALGFFHRLPAVGRGRHLVAAGPDNHGQQLARVFVIVHHQDARGHHSPATFMAGPVAETHSSEPVQGSSTIMAVPRPLPALSALTVPPCNWTS